jgi:hypothetical protein
MIGEIPISDACLYMDAHDTETETSASCAYEFLDSVPNIGWLWHSKYLGGRQQMALGNWEL